MFSKYNLYLEIHMKYLIESFGSVFQNFPKLNSDKMGCLVSRFEASVARWCDNWTGGIYIGCSNISADRIIVAEIGMLEESKLRGRLA